MTSPNPTPNSDPISGHFSPALLALKRFIRGTLRQVGIGVISLAIALNLGTHAPGWSAGIASEFSLFSSTDPATQENLSQPVQHLTRNDTSDGASDGASDDTSLEKFSRRPFFQAHSAILSRSRHTVSARMTHHHLTSARLSIPAQSDQGAVSVAGAQ